MGSRMSKGIMDNVTGPPKAMPLHLLEEITDGFSEHRKLGGGTYGDVYLGVHKDGEKIAVKVLKNDLSLDDMQFEKEYHNIASLHHKNIVRLIGYCNETRKEFITYNERIVLAEKTKRMLCFEYMHNGSLDKFISDESNGHNWLTRYAIIKGVSEGLEYLHEKLNPPMYHLDLKPANVLLDENMSPKIADFGLSRLVGGDKTHFTENRIGTHGYIPPEHIDAGAISTKFDVYSFGVVIIKIISGRDGYLRSAEMSSQQFINLVHTDWMNRIHATSVGMYSIQVRRCIEIALSCVDNDRDKRPSIGLIVTDLNKTESRSQVLLDALRSHWSSLPTSQLCPCITTDHKMLDLLKEKLISYQLRITDNRSTAHLVTITTACDRKVGTTSKSKPVRPRIKIIDYEECLSWATSMDAHSTKPWILLCHGDGEVTIWNHQNQTRVMAIHLNSDWEFTGQFYIGGAKFVEPLMCFVTGDVQGYIHVYSYEKVDKLQSFRGHTTNVTSLAVHPSEPLVLSASFDGLIKLWNWEAGWQCIRTFEGHSGRVYRVKFNPRTAGNTFASHSEDSTIKMWNMDSPTPVASFECHQGPAGGLDYFCPGGALQYLVTYSPYVGIAQIWDLQTKTCIKLINGLQEYACNIAVVEGPLGRPILLTVSEDHTVAFCDSTTHRYGNRVNFNLGYVRGFAYIAMTKSIAVLCDKGIAIMEID
nr:uncharacterized protein LOC127319780 isoform X1 [Lolium perenne]